MLLSASLMVDRFILIFFKSFFFIPLPPDCISLWVFEFLTVWTSWWPSYCYFFYENAILFISFDFIKQKPTFCGALIIKQKFVQKPLL